MDSIRYEQFGWKENYDALLVGTALIRGGGREEYAYGDEHLSPRMEGMRLNPQGSLEAWSGDANRFFAPGFEAHAFALLCSFGSILMPFVCGATDGGAVLALHTPGSGFGKSNALQAVASVWGEYDSLALSGNDTTNAMFNKIARACNLPVYMEEMGKRDPVIETNFIKGYITGKEKDRSRRDGSVEYKNSRWKNIMISASNHSLADILRLGGDQGAMARVFEITVEWPDKETFKDFSKVCARMLTNSGYAGRAFAFALMHPGMKEYIQSQAEKIVNKLIVKFNTKARDRYILYLLACCYISAPILNSAGILSFDVNRIMDWAISKGDERIKQYTPTSSIDSLNEFINEHAMDGLVMQEPFHPKKQNVVIKHPKNRVAMRLETSVNTLYIPVVILRRWCDKNNVHYNSMALELLKANIVRAVDKQMTLAAGTDYPRARILCWDIDVSRPEISGILALARPTAESEEKSLASNS